MINVNYEKTEQPDGTFKVVFTFTGLSEQQADKAKLLIEQAMGQRDRDDKQC
jgi:hypothetical protein